jgi:hypothetical protein
MPTLIPDIALFQRVEARRLSLATYQAGETVLTAGSRTGRLLILREGAVEGVKEGVQIAKVTEPTAGRCDCWGSTSCAASPRPTSCLRRRSLLHPPRCNGARRNGAEHDVVRELRLE